MDQPRYIEHQGRRYARVSTVLQPLVDLSGIPADVLNRKRALGSALHFAAELVDEGTLDESTVHEDVRPYLDAYREAVALEKFRWTLTEERLYSPLGFCGQIDRFGTDRHGYLLLDLKTTFALSPAVGVQLAAYKRLVSTTLGLQNIGARIRRCALQLTPAGKYRIREFDNPDDDACFMGLLSVHNWQAKNQ